MSPAPLAQPADPLPGPHGGDGPAVARYLGLDPDTMLDLSASLNPLAPDVAAILRRVDDRCVSTYPDAERATEALADAIGVPVDRLLLTNGGAEAIALVAAEHPIGAAPQPAFSLYRKHLTATGEDGTDEDGTGPARPSPRCQPCSSGPTCPAGSRA